MDHQDMASSGETDFTVAVPLEISEETASRTEDLLREFAEDAALDTVLVVDRSGALVAGISAEEDVTVEVISALVAGASGAMRALAAQLGETGSMESLHLGGDRLVYLKETVHRFVLVAVSETSRPAGLVRQKALAIEESLADILSQVRPAVPPPPPAVPISVARSLRETVRERAALRQASPPSPESSASPDDSVGGPVFEIDSGDEEEEEEEEREDGIEMESEREESFEFPDEDDTEGQEDFARGDLPAVEEERPHERVENREDGQETQPSVVDEPTLSSLPEEPPIPIEPREILEPIDFGEPEIAIESTLSPALESHAAEERVFVDSPFEPEEEKGNSSDDFGTDDSVFEYDSSEEEEVEEDSEEWIAVPSPAGEDEPPAKVNPDSLRMPPPFPEVSATALFEEDDGVDEDDGEEEAERGIEGADEVAEDPLAGGEEESAEPPRGIRETILFEIPLEPSPGPVAKRKESSSEPGKSRNEEPASDLAAMIDEEEEESEIQRSGPFYF